MNEQKQIEEIQAILPNIEVVKAMYGDVDFAKLLYDKGVRKIFEGAVVMMREEFDEDYVTKEDRDYWKHKAEIYKEHLKKSRKETAEKIMNEISGDILTISTIDYGSIEVVPLDRISEICENVIRGDKQ